MAGAGDPGRLVETRAVRGGLHDGTDAEATLDSARPIGRLARAEPWHVEGGQGRLERLPWRDVVQHLACRHGVRQVGVSEHVASPDLDRIER